VNDPLGQRGQILAAVMTGQDHLEFIAAQPPDPPGFTHRALQPARHLFEQGIARRMAHRIVDLLEPVEIEHQNRTGAFTPAGGGENLFERAAHLHAVGKAGERIIMRKARDLLFGPALFRQVSPMTAEAAEVLVAVIDRTAGQRPPAFIAAGRCADFDIVEGRARRKMKGDGAFGIGRALRRIDNLAQGPATNFFDCFSERQRRLW